MFTGFFESIAAFKQPRTLIIDWYLSQMLYSTKDLVR